jgi:regulator of CtrA degradation
VLRIARRGNYVSIFGVFALYMTPPAAQCWLWSPGWRKNKKTTNQNNVSVSSVEACDMSEQTANEAGPVSFGERLANSQVFTDLFRDGMALVEETASYLDGPGRQESKKLERSVSLVYATESMRLTTRLMQLASWLLLHRAVKEGEMSLAHAQKEKTKVKLSGVESGEEQNIKLLPERLRALIERSRTLQSAVRRLDATMHPNADPARFRQANPVERQLGLLKAAFERE